MSIISQTQLSEHQLSLVIQAISDETRRALLARLARGPAMITQLAEPFAMSLPAVSKHLRILERAQLVERSVSGRVHTFSATPQVLQNVDQWLSHYRSFWSDNLDRLETYARNRKEIKRSSKKR